MEIFAECLRYESKKELQRRFVIVIDKLYGSVQENEKKTITKEGKFHI